MIFIFIGPDMAGKTTLAKSISREDRRTIVPLVYRKFSHYPTPEESVVAAENTVNEISQNKGPYDVSIFDRFHYPDDLVYGPATKRYDIPQDIFARYVNGVGLKLMKLDTAYIYCYADIDVLTARYAERGDDYIVPAYLPDIIAGYLKWISGPYAAGFKILKLNSGILSPGEMIEATEQFMLQQMDRVYNGRLGKK